MKRRQEISGIDTSMVGQELECPDSFMNSKRWEVPDFMNTLPIDIRGSVIYSVHAVLDNIVI